QATRLRTMKKEINSRKSVLKNLLSMNLSTRIKNYLGMHKREKKACYYNTVPSRLPLMRKCSLIYFVSHQKKEKNENERILQTRRLPLRKLLRNNIHLKK